jgi:Tfp pilus assembly protein PilN
VIPKKLHINLKPGSIERKKKEFLREGFKKAITYQAIVLVFLLLANLFFMLQIGGLKRKLSLISEEWKTTEPLLKQRDVLMLFKDGYSEVLKSIKTIFKRNLYWSDVLKTFSRLIPEEVWFKEMALKQSGNNNILEIKAAIGYLDSDEAKIEKMNSFIDLCRHDATLSDNFQIPDLQDVTKVKDKNSDILDLKFSFTLKDK